MVSSKEDDQQENESESEQQMSSKSEELNEQQIQQLVDAERMARQQKQKDLEQLFRQSEW